MINTINNYFYELSRQHKLIMTYRFDELSKIKGIGYDKYPLCFLEEPLYISNRSVTNGKVSATVNFDILLTPQQLENWDIKQPTTEDLQNVAYHIALNYIAKIRDDYHNSKTSIQVLSYSFITLERFGDDNAYGVRCTLNLLVDNDIYFCDVEDHFDENKEINITSILPNINSDNASSCSGDFSYKLPKIKL